MIYRTNLCQTHITHACHVFIAYITDFELSEEETCRATIRMFVDFNLVSQFNIPYDVSTHLPSDWICHKNLCASNIIVGHI
jgi:hypothetical protein